MKNIHTKNKKGFTLLFAVIVSTLVLAVGASVISVALRQRVLSNTGRESQIAFYAANTAMECALYWDLNPPVSNSPAKVFPLETAPVSEYRESNLGNVTCAGGNLKDGTGFPANSFTGQVGVGGTQWVENGNKTTFRIAMQNSLNPTLSVPKNLYCAEVTVEKSLDLSDGRVITVITSQGLNMCDINDPRAVQRGLVLEYKI